MREIGEQFNAVDLIEEGLVVACVLDPSHADIIEEALTQDIIVRERHRGWSFVERKNSNLVFLKIPKYPYR